MENSFLIVMSIWVSINILFVIVRLWATRLENRQRGPFHHQLRAVRVRSQPSRGV